VKFGTNGLVKGALMVLGRFICPHYAECDFPINGWVLANGFLINDEPLALY